MYLFQQSLEVVDEVAVHWFRRDLRLHDNEGLLRAAECCTKLIPLYILDSHYLDPDKHGSNYLGFLLDSLRDLDNDLKDIGSQLFIAKGDPVNVMEKLLSAFNVSKVTFSRATGKHNQSVEKRITEISVRHGGDVESFWSNTLYDPDYLLSVNCGIIPEDAESFLHCIASNSLKPPKPLASPTNLPPPPLDVVEKVEGVLPAVPGLEDIKEYGYDPEKYTTTFLSGERTSIDRMKNFMSRKQVIFGYSEVESNVISREDPTSSPPKTSGLSPYLSLGSLSVRLLFCNLRRAERSPSMKIQAIIQNALRCFRKYRIRSSLELLYCREYTYLLDYMTEGNLDIIGGHHTCIYKHIPWVRGEEAEQLIRKWEMGETGYPAVDACMNQLRHDGWVHNLGRHMAACFLTGGDLMVWWEHGRDVFAKYLVDYDRAINNYQWHWLSCKAFFSEYFCSLNPVTTYKQFDRHGTYVRTHVPVLKNFPDQYIYEPWRAPEEVQEAAGCIIGRDYPPPMVDHAEAFVKNKIMVQKVAEECANTVVFTSSLSRKSYDGKMETF